MSKSNKTALFFILGVMNGLLICCGQSKQQRQFFLERAKRLGNIIMTQASADMNLVNMYNTVWEYAKVTDLDFNSAYKEMMMDTSGIKLQMEENMQMMNRLMNMVKDPPKNYIGIHDKLIELRELYLEFNKFVFQMPQVSQQEFNDEADAYVEDINSLKSELDGMITEAEADL